MPGAPSNLRLFEDALAWFRSRTIISDDEFRKLDDAVKARAFSIAGVSNLKMLQSVFDDLEHAIRNGVSFDDFKRASRLKLLRAWGTSQPWRVEAIFRTEVQKAYQAGRYRQLTQQSVKNLRPFWIFDAVLDSKTSAICKSHDGTIRHQDDPYWQSNYPPLHVNCRSGVRALRRSDVAKRGGPTARLPDVPPQAGFGPAPVSDAVDEPIAPRNVDPELAAEAARKDAASKAAARRHGP